MSASESPASTGPNVIVLDDDDDVVITGEDKVQAVPAQGFSMRASVKDVAKIIAEAKAMAKESEKDISRFQEEIEVMQNSLGDAVYESLKYLVQHSSKPVEVPITWAQLRDVVFGILEGLTSEDLGELSVEEIRQYSNELSSVEKGNQTVSKMFLDCHIKLKDLRTSLTSEMTTVEKEIGILEKGTSQPMLIDSDDEDADVTITGATMNGSQGQGTRTAAPGHGEATGIPPMEELRSQFKDAVSKSMPTLLSSLQSQQKTGSQNGQYPQNTIGPLKRQDSGSKVDGSTEGTQYGLPQRQSIQRPGPVPTIRWPDLKVGDKVFGKKFNDVWYSGTIQDIYLAGVDGNTEWKCKVKFDGKGMKVLNGKNIAYRDPISCMVRVGTRVVALYREDDAPNSFFAGVIAEAPSHKNNKRFLVFFDDGYAQYCESKELHKVYMQSLNVWEDIDPETSAFIKEYLRIYPERPMVRLSRGQVVRTEWNGRWWTSKVVETDASLVKMYFQADKRTEWIYRGSTRLEPLFKALVNADAIKAAGSSRGRRHNLTMRPSDGTGTTKRPDIEYTRGTVDDDNSNNSTASASKNKAAPPNKPPEKPPEKITEKITDKKNKSNVARKSTGTSGVSSPVSEIGADGDAGNGAKWEGPWLKYQRKATPGQKQAVTTDSAPAVPASGATKVVNNTGFFKQAKELSSKDIASVLQERLASSQMEYDEEKPTGERKDIMVDTRDMPRILFKPHTCCPKCVKESDDRREKHKGRCALMVPLLCGWERQICKARPSTKRFVVYRAPCGRRLRCIEEVDRYLLITNSVMTIDLYSFDHQLHVNTEFVPYTVKTFCDIKDLSYGVEPYPVSCVNGVDRHFPDYVEYANKRIPSKGVYINTDPDFFPCCDCTDNCRDRTKCACQQMTIQNTACVGERDVEAGYHYRKLREPLFTGITECNSRCSCDKRCLNRVAQHGLQMRLQVFKTEKKGWGLRCLDDISKGSFICIYAGQLLTDRGANEDGKQYGDEYLAELDFIEVVEGQKEGYESGVEDFSDDADDANYKVSRDSEEDSDYNQSYEPDVGERRRSSRKASKASENETAKQDDPTSKKKEEEKQTSQEDIIDISDEDDEEVSKKVEKPSKPDSEPNSKKHRAKKSTGGSRFNLSTNLKSGQEPIPDKDKQPGEKKEYISTRTYFDDPSECYIMDAKSMGNLGRYLNHSCSPNVFVQNIFVDTHDLRFPWVAFFAGQYIRAGTELTWDYNYEVGSVPDKIMYCYCGSSTCRGRLL